MSKHSFKESVIIPKSLYERLREEEQTKQNEEEVKGGENYTEDLNVVHNDSVNEPETTNLTLKRKRQLLKEKLYKSNPYVVYSTEINKPIKTNPVHDLYRKPFEWTEDLPDVGIPLIEILNQVPISQQPNTKAILTSFIELGHSWDKTRQLIINNKTIHGSDIIKIIRYMTKSSRRLGKEFEPLGFEEFFNIIKDIVPHSWIKNKPYFWKERKVITKLEPKYPAEEHMEELKPKSKDDIVVGKSYHPSDVLTSQQNIPMFSSFTKEGEEVLDKSLHKGRHTFGEAALEKIPSFISPTKKLSVIKNRMEDVFDEKEYRSSEEIDDSLASSPVNLAPTQKYKSRKILDASVLNRSKRISKPSSILASGDYDVSDVSYKDGRLNFEK